MNLYVACSKPESLSDVSQIHLQPFFPSDIVPITVSLTPEYNITMSIIMTRPDFCHELSRRPCPSSFHLY